jgi:hypothetical protein
MAGKGTRIICRRIFKYGEKADGSQFTKKWIELINHQEKIKKLSAKKE